MNNMENGKRIPLCCEICMKHDEDVSSDLIKIAANKWLFSHGITITLGRHDPTKIICEILNRSCDYIVIEPAVPIKIVKEYNEAYENNIKNNFTNTHYSIYEVNSYENLMKNETGNLKKDETNLTDTINMDEITMNNDSIYNSKKRKNYNISKTISQTPHKVYCKDNQNDIKENIINSKLLYTIPVIGEKSISSMEDDPIILPNFCCVVNIVTYYKNDEYIEEKINENIEDELIQQDEKKIPIYSQYILPHINFHKLWDNLYYEENIKKDLLEYVSTLMLFATKKIDTNLINYNRLILFYGPPGTGKTSLCKALANKICIRLSNIFTTGILIELNTHNLFSKWFSESGKQVMKLFTKIKKIINDYDENDIFICLLIDEVESLSSARKKAMDNTEPTDSIRVVNALLTQIDSLKYYHNTLLLTTSNITEMIDDAFIDRVDLKQFIGLPNEECRYEIYRGCINELINKGIINCIIKIPSYQKIMKYIKNGKEKENKEYIYGNELIKCVKLSKGFSGRCLRRIPFQAYAYFCQATLRFYNSTNNQGEFLITIEEFLEALYKAIQKEKLNRQKLIDQNI